MAAASPPAAIPAQANADAECTDIHAAPTDSRLFKSPLRQNGFTVYPSEAICNGNGNGNGSGSASASPTAAPTNNPNHMYLNSSRSRTSTTSSTVTLKEHAVGMSSNGHSAPLATTFHRTADGDVEMGDIDEKPTTSSALRPLPIPRSSIEPRSIGGTTASQTPSEVATPPDTSSAGLIGLKAPLYSSSAAASNAQMAAKLSSLSSISPRINQRNLYSNQQQSYRLSAYSAVRCGSSSGPNGAFPAQYSSLVSSTHWSPSNHSSDPHLYSISSSAGGHGSSYPYPSVKPYLSTSFKTSAERSGSSHLDEDDENDEDVFGHTASSLGLQEPPRGSARAHPDAPSVGEETDGDGDALGVFSFSSPYLRPRSINDNVPGLPPSPPEGTQPSGSGSGLGGAAGAPADRVLSPTVTARSLQKLSLGGGVEMSSTSSGAGSGGIGASRRSRPSYAHHSYSQTNLPPAYSRSLPSGSAAFHQRRLSSGRLARPIMAASSVSAYSISPSGAAAAAAFGSATLYSRSPSGNSPYGRSPAATGGFSRASPYSAAATSRVPTTFAVEMPTPRERSRSRQRWATPKGPQAKLYRDEGEEDNRAAEGGGGGEEEEDEEEEEEDDATDDEMIVDGAVSSRMASFAPSSMPLSSNLAAVAAAAAATTPTAAPTAPFGSSPDGGRPPPSNCTASTPSQALSSKAVEVEDDGIGPPPDEMTQVAAIRDRLGGAANCAAFIAKLWYLVARPARYGKYLHWNSMGTTVILSTDPEISNEFASDVLPRLWNHANYSSFIRQMNLYGFQRLPSSRTLDKAELQAAVASGLKGPDGQSPTELSTAQQLYGSHSSFLHPKFVRGREDWLPLLKPRNAKRPKAASSEKRDDAGDADE